MLLCIGPGLFAVHVLSLAAATDGGVDDFKFAVETLLLTNELFPVVVLFV